MLASMKKGMNSLSELAQVDVKEMSTDVHKITAVDRFGSQFSMIGENPSTLEADAFEYYTSPAVMRGEVSIRRHK
jgi:hypothetical protein